MGHPAEGHGLAQGLDHGVLAHQVGEDLRAPLLVKAQGCHG